MFAAALARPIRRGIELLPRTSATEGGTPRGRGSERHEPARRRVAQRLGDEAAGTQTSRDVRPEASPVPVTRRAIATHTRKGPSPCPCQSCTVPAAAERVRRGAERLHRNPAQLWEFEHFLWTRRCPSVDHGATSGGTRRMFATALAPPRRQGIELLPRTPATESGTARRRGSARRKPGLPGGRRGGWATKPPGPESRSSRPGASPVPVNQKGPWNSYFRGPFAFPPAFPPACPAGPAATPAVRGETPNRLTGG